MPKDVTHSLGYIHSRTLTIVLQSLLQVCRQAALHKAPYLSWTRLQGHMPSQAKGHFMHNAEEGL